MKCPVDHADLSSQPYEGNVQVEECSSCKGIWLTKEKLFAIERMKENDYHEVVENHKPASEARMETTVSIEKPRDLNCPSCQSPMLANEHGYFSGIIIDTCIACGGVWLDRGELEALEIFFEQNHPEPSSFWGAFQHGLRFLLGLEK